MKIVFICGSLEPGKDGVGDYTTSLGSELIRLGHEITAVGLIDKFAQKKSDELRKIGDKTLRCLRLPASENWTDRCDYLDNVLTQIQPDWISLQIVPWTFNSKGCMFGIGRRLAKILTSHYSLQIMFHELWIGNAAHDPFKERALGAVQKHYIKQFIKQLTPEICQTSNPFFYDRLASVHKPISLLPLFGNIPIKNQPQLEQLDRLLAEKTGNELLTTSNDQWILGGVFGSLHPNWNAMNALAEALSHAQAKGKHLGIVLMGRNGPHATQFRNQLSRRFDDQISCYELGELSAELVSGIFSMLDFGLATSPFGLVGKSGSAIAMLEHGLPLLVTRTDVAAPRVESDKNFIASKATLFEAGNFDWESFLNSKSIPRSMLPIIAQQFMKSLEASPPPTPGHATSNSNTCQSPH